MRLSLVTPPEVEPIELALARKRLRVDANAEDDLIVGLCMAAREYFEEETGTQLAQATYTGRLDCFPDHGLKPIEVPRPPLQSVEGITYIDANGDSQTWDAAEYMVDTFAGTKPRKGIVYPRPGFSYPSTRRISDAVTITFVAGLAEPSLVPESVKAALLMVIGDLFENRESQVIGTIVTPNRLLDRIINRYRVPVYA